MKTLVLIVGLAAIPASVVVAQSIDTNEFPSDLLLLIQSELDYLDVAGREISLDLDELAPDKALERIASVAGLSIEVDGTLPETPLLTESFESATVKEVLTWYAKKVSVTYRAKSPDTLVVVAGRGSSEKNAAG